MPEIDEDWEEWNPETDKFWVHATAGSLAGIMEHTLIFPLDTVKVQSLQQVTALNIVVLAFGRLPSLSFCLSMFPYCFWTAVALLLHRHCL